MPRMPAGQSGSPLGYYTRPSRQWGGTGNFSFKLGGKSDSEYLTDPGCKSVNGWSIFLEGCCLAARSKKMPARALPAAEAELCAAAQCAQGLMLAWRAMACMGLKVEFPMILEIDSKGAAGLCSSWPAGGRARHASVKQFFLRDLKEAGMLKIIHMPGVEMTSDIFTKNTPKDIFEKHGSKLYGEDKYYKQFVASKTKKDVAALPSVWNDIVDDLPPLKSEKAPKSFTKSKNKKKGCSSTKRARRTSSKGECRSAYAVASTS